MKPLSRLSNSRQSSLLLTRHLTLDHDPDHPSYLLDGEPYICSEAINIIHGSTPNTIRLTVNYPAGCGQQTVEVDISDDNCLLRLEDGTAYVDIHEALERDLEALIKSHQETDLVVGITTHNDNLT
jgi:hypothetical protein